MNCPVLCVAKKAACAGKSRRNSGKISGPSPCFVFGGTAGMCAADRTFGFEFCRRFPPARSRLPTAPARPPPRPSTRGADKSNDGSPFAALLTATSQQTHPKPKSDATQAANNNDAIRREKHRSANSTARPRLQSPPRAHGDRVQGAKRDKKADNGDDSSDDVTAARSSRHAQPTCRRGRYCARLPANAQAASTTEDDAGPDAIEAASSAATNSGSMTTTRWRDQPGRLPTSRSPPVRPCRNPQPNRRRRTVQTGPGVPHPIAAADDTDSAPTNSPVAVSTLAQNAVSTIIQNTGPAPQPKTSDGKPPSTRRAQARCQASDRSPDALSAGSGDGR